MFFKVLLLNLIPRVLPVEYSSFFKFVYYYIGGSVLDSFHGNLALLLAFFVFLRKDIYKLLVDFFKGFHLLFVVKRSMQEVYLRHEYFFFAFYLIVLGCVEYFFKHYEFNIRELSYIYIAQGLLTFLPLYFRIIGKKPELNLYLWPLFALTAFITLIQGVSLLLMIVVFLRVFSVDLKKANSYAFMSLLLIILIDNSMSFGVDFYEFLYFIFILVSLYAVDYLLKRRNFYEISAFYIVLGIWTILDLFFS